MDLSENVVSLQEFIAMVPSSSLPRIIKIASGVYLQSSVYDIHGSECCLSTGDLVKVIEKELQTVSCVDLCTEMSRELPHNFAGDFQICVDKCVYDTLEKLKKALSCGDYTIPFWFASQADIIIGTKVIKKNRPIQYISSGKSKNIHYAKCRTWDDSRELCLKLPFKTPGQFYEYESEETYKLGEVLESPALMKRNLKCSSLGKSSYRLYPVYEMKTRMQMRKDVVKIPSSLEVDMVDITNQCGDINFTCPLSLTEAFEHNEQFPVVAEIVESSECNHFLKSEIFSHLKKGQKLILYKKTFSTKVLASATKSKAFRFFYIHDVYQGKFRQRPREFPTVYDLWTKAVEGIKLNVVVTKDCESVDNAFPSLSIGDHLKILYPTKTSSVYSEETDILVCRKDSEDDEEEPEEIMLPMYLEGRFVEEVANNAKFTLNNIIQKCKLPCEVKAVVKDPSLTTDPLTSFASIRLEEFIEEPVLLASFLKNPSECFEIPIKCLDISLMFLEEPVPDIKELTSTLRVEELTEWFYYDLQKQLPENVLPPPRPPKRQVNIQVETSHNLHLKKKEPDLMELKPPALPDRVPHKRCPVEAVKKNLESCTLQNKNTYTSMPLKMSISTDDELEEDHDYETIPTLENLKSTHEIIY
ncbi:protein THEMIS2 [Bombina bombina]|uniref:protein THEMIS2 n=1 Tax=Bombina bombina TaxID=8345 RepID=UPI00235ADF75|nr:protein THEMIS2 [Bombina bombina]